MHSRANINWATDCCKQPTAPHPRYQGAKMPRKANTETCLQFLLRTITSCSPDKCILWPFSVNADGYGKLSIKGRDTTAHRVSFLATNGFWPYPETLHSCHTPACFNPFHLRQGTRLENERDARRRGKYACNVKVNTDGINRIRGEYIRGDPVHGARPLARKYGVDRKQIRNIALKKCWPKGFAQDHSRNNMTHL